MGKEKIRPKPFADRIRDLRGIDCRKAIIGFEWLCEWISYGLSRWAFLEVLEYLGKLSLLVALIVWIYPGCRERREAADSAKQAAADARKSRHYVAWQTINTAIGKPGNAGRADALEELIRDGVRLDGISLSGGVNLFGPLNMANASMAHADFSDGHFEAVDFSRDNLDFSKWNNTFAESCKFHGASFWAATFNNSTFVWCDFGYAEDGKNQRGALFLTQFTGDRTEFRLCNFAGAEFPMNNWQSVHFAACNLACVEVTHMLTCANTPETLFCCNLYGATATPDIIKWASTQRVAFTNVVSLERWIYCVTNRMLDYDTRGPGFMNWASNQFSICNKTNDPQAWLNWSRVNLKH